MFERILEIFASPGLVFFGAILSFIIPWGVYRINRKLHQYGDPPWKTKEDSEIE